MRHSALIAAAMLAAVGGLPEATIPIPAPSPRKRKPFVQRSPVADSEIAAWNAKVEERKAAKRARKESHD